MIRGACCCRKERKKKNNSLATSRKTHPCARPLCACRRTPHPRSCVYDNTDATPGDTCVRCAFAMAFARTSLVYLESCKATTPLCTNQASALITHAASASRAIVSTEAALEASRAQLAPAPDLLLRARKERDECVAQPLQFDPWAAGPCRHSIPLHRAPSWRSFRCKVSTEQCGDEWSAQTEPVPRAREATRYDSARRETISNGSARRAAACHTVVLSRRLPRACS